MYGFIQISIICNSKRHYFLVIPMQKARDNIDRKSKTGTFTTKTMEKNEKESESSKNRSDIYIKVFLLALTVVIVVESVVIGKGFASLNDRLKSVEEKTLGDKSLRSEATKSGKRRSKRGTDETDIRKALIKLEKLEGRLGGFQSRLLLDFFPLHIFFNQNHLWGCLFFS